MHEVGARTRSLLGPRAVKVTWALAVVAIAALFPSTASAQATIAGVVRDASGAVLPGVTVEAASPVLIEKVRSATTDGTGQYRITELPPGTYSLTMTLPGFSDGQARRRRGGGRRRPDHQRRVTRRRRAGNHHGHRREPDRRRAEHAPSADRGRRNPEGAPGHARLQRPRVPGALGHGRQQPDRPDALDAHLLQPRRPRQRRPRVGGRPERRLGVQRRRRVGLHRRHVELAGNADDAVGRSRRDRDGRRHRQLRAEDRRQHVLGQRLLQQRRPVVAGQQHRRPAQGLRSARAAGALSRTGT